MAGRVLIVDEVATNRIVMRVKLASAFLETVPAASGTEALEHLSAGGVSLVILNAALPDMTGVELIARIRALPTQGDLPLVLVQPGHDPAQRLAALSAGADDVLERPLDETLLVARLRSLMRARDSLDDLRLHEGSAAALGLAEASALFDRPARIAVIAAHGATAEPLADLLRRRVNHKVTVHDIADLLRGNVGGTGVPDLGIVMLDGRPGDSAVQAIASLRSQPETRGMAVMALLPGPDRALAAEALDRGADDEMCGPVHADELLLRLSRLIGRKRRQDRLRDTLHDGLRAAVTDPLTGLYNRRYALPRLGEMVASLRPGGQGLAVMVADIDHFKQVNDRHGHAAGDAVLVEVARRLRGATGSQDLLGRIGGEEFVIVQSGQDGRVLQAAARRLCRAVGDRAFRLPGQAGQLRITISIGLALAQVPPGAGPASPRPAPETLLAQADRALYHSKMLGRNKVTLDSSAA